jgi:hypothetical protein
MMSRSSCVVPCGYRSRAAAWTGLTRQATASLRSRSPPWRYVTVSPPVRLGAVIRSGFVRSRWSRLDRQTCQRPWHEHAGDGRGVAYIPLYQAFRRLPRRSIVETLLRTLAADISPSRRSCDRVFGFSVHAPASTRGAGNRAFCRSVASMPATACRFPGQAYRGGIRSSAWVHSPGPTIRQFILDELPAGARTVRWLRARLTSRVPDQEPGLQCPW